jgi:hypothetical protein
LADIIRAYDLRRNYAVGLTTSRLSPYLLRRLVLEEEVLAYARAERVNTNETNSCPVHITIQGCGPGSRRQMFTEFLWNLGLAWSQADISKSI